MDPLHNTSGLHTDNDSITKIPMKTNHKKAKTKNKLPYTMKHNRVGGR